MSAATTTNAASRKPASRASGALMPRARIQTKSARSGATSALANARRWPPVDLMQLGIGGAGAAAMVPQVQRAMLAVTEPEGSVEQHCQTVKRRDARRRSNVQKLVQRQRQADVDERNRGDEQYCRQQSGERAREERVHRHGPAESRVKVSARIGGVAPGGTGGGRGEACVSPRQQALLTCHHCPK